MHELVIIDRDESLRHMFHLVAQDEGYQSTLFASDDAALAYLHDLPSRAIVIFEHNPLALHRSQSLLWYLVDKDTTLRYRHRYILTTNTIISETTRQLLPTLHIPLLSKPFSLEDLLMLLHSAKQHLEAPGN